jgi:hypothetical protein
MMTQEEVLAAAQRFVADNALVVGPLQAIHLFPAERDADLVIPARWGVYYRDMTPVDDERREEWGDQPTIVIVDDTTGKAKLFCYL